MSHPTWSTLAVACLTLALSACSQYPPLQVNAPATSPALAPSGLALNLSSAGAVAVRGIVQAPPIVVAAGGANVVAAGGANVVAAGGANVVAAGGGNLSGLRHVAALEAEVPVPGARVALADLSGAELTAYPATTTDAEGRYTFPAVPPSGLYMIVATFQSPRGEAIALRTVGQAGRDAEVQHVSVATTLVARMIQKRADAAVTFEPTAFQAIVDAVAVGLEEADVASLAHPEAIDATATAAVARAGQVNAVATFGAKATPDTAPPASGASTPATHSSSGGGGGVATAIGLTIGGGSSEAPANGGGGASSGIEASVGGVTSGASSGGSGASSGNAGSSSGTGGASGSAGSSGNAGADGKKDKEQEKADKAAEKAAAEAAKQAAEQAKADEKAKADAEKAQQKQADEAAKAEEKAAAEAKKQAEHQAKADEKADDGKKD